MKVYRAVERAPSKDFRCLLQTRNPSIPFSHKPCLTVCFARIQTKRRRHLTFPNRPTYSVFCLLDVFQKSFKIEMCARSKFCVQVRGKTRSVIVNQLIIFYRDLIQLTCLYRSEIWQKTYVTI